MAWLFVPGLEELSSDLSSPSAPITEPFVTSSGKPTRRPTSWRGWRKRPWIKLLSGMNLSHSTASRGVASFILLQRASPASPGAPRESDGELRMTVGFGRELPESFATFDRATSSWKIPHRSLVGDWKSYSGTWPKAGTMLNGIVSRRATWEPPTSAVAFSSSHNLGNWGTPTVQDLRVVDGKMRPSRLATGRKTEYLARQVVMWSKEQNWASPASADSVGTNGGGQTRSLRRDVRNWATPRGSDQNGPGFHGKRGQDLRTMAAEHAGYLSIEERSFRTTHQEGKSEPGDKLSRRRRGSLPRLNPDFTDWLMGLPIGWSDSLLPETEWYHWRLVSRTLLSELATKGTLSREQLGFNEIEEEE